MGSPDWGGKRLPGIALGLATFPGVVQMVDSVNSPHFLANGATRDAILIGGSDPDGTAKAADAFLSLIRDLPKYAPPKVEQKMEIDETPDKPRQ